jgi:hypothetical protein
MNKKRCRIYFVDGLSWYCYLSFIDSISPTYMSPVGINSTLRSSIKCVKSARSPVPQATNESNMSVKTATKRLNENCNGQEHAEPVKRARVLSRPADDNSLGSSRIVLRIRKTSEDLSSSRNETFNNASGHQLTVEIKEPLVTLKEDDENEDGSQTSSSSNTLHIDDQTEEFTSNHKKDNE